MNGEGGTLYSGGIPNEASRVLLDVFPSHECTKSGGRWSAGGVVEGVYGGRGIILSTILMNKGGADFNLNLIC